MWGRWSPIKVHNTFDLDGALIEKAHTRKLIYGDRSTLSQTSNILVISGPFEGGPNDLSLDRLACLIVGVAGKINIGEGTERLSSLDIPDNVVLSIIINRQCWVTFFWD